MSITIDTWTFIQRINYVYIIAHFVDSKWKLQKIISFIPISSHMGGCIAKALKLVSLGIRNVFTVIVDNESSINTVMGIFYKIK